MIKDLLGAINPHLAVLDGVPLGVFLIVVLLTLFFFASYAYKGTQIARQLRSAVNYINRQQKGGPVKPADIASVLKWNPASHLWTEYADSLHDLKRASSGALTLSEVRATMPAEAYFTREVLVDSRLLDDFTRHLPGVLTGLGIIGTFAGLLDGLASFDPSTTATAVAGLAPLMAGVRHAFISSATAIGCAMLILFSSKLLLAYLYRLVEKLTQSIDALYATGAGEEYLSRLVQASEKSEAHAAQLKEALIEDLSSLMTNLTERQILAQSDASRSLGEHIGNTISSTLADPLRKMTESMETTSRGNSDAVSSMLETMLAGFMAKLEDTFGNQMRGINEQMRESVTAMTAVQASFKELVEAIAKTNKEASEEMSNKLAEAMHKATESQALLTEQMREFITEFRISSKETQDKSREALDTSLEQVLKKVSSAVMHLEKFRLDAAADEKERGERFAGESKAVIEGLSSEVETLLKAVAEQVVLTQQNINEVGKVSLNAISSMNEGALRMGSAAERFKDAGGSMAGVFERSAKVSEQLSVTASTLQTAAAVAKQSIDQYEQTRRTIDGNISTLSKLIESADGKAGLTKEMLNDMQRIVQELKKAELQSQQYFEQVNTTLEKSFKDFGTQLASVVAKTISDTDRHLGNGISQLNGVVQALQLALSRLKKA